MVIGTLLIDRMLSVTFLSVTMAGVLDISLYIFSSMCQLIKVNTKSISDDDFRNNICTRKYSKKSASAVHRLTYGIIFIIYSAHQVLVQKKSNGTAWIISVQAWFLADHGNVFLPVVCLCVMLVYCRWLPKRIEQVFSRQLLVLHGVQIRPWKGTPSPHSENLCT